MPTNPARETAAGVCEIEAIDHGVSDACMPAKRPGRT